MSLMLMDRSARRLRCYPWCCLYPESLIADLEEHHVEENDKRMIDSKKKHILWDGLLYSSYSFSIIRI